MTEPVLGWDLLADLQLLLQYHFMQNAALTGTAVAIAAGAVGYFVVLRGQTFAAHMLAQVGFPGAAAAALLHLPPALGLLAFCLGGAGGLRLLGARLGTGGRAESAAVGSLLAFSLGLGLLIFRLFPGNTPAIYAFLFGSILGVSEGDATFAVAAALACVGLLAGLARPLLFASVDPDVAAARGVPVGAITTAFVLLVGLAVAGSVQVVGALLVFALMVAPAATAQRVTSRPYRGLVLSIGLAVAFTWAGLTVAYFGGYPVGFAVSTIALVTYLVARLAGPLHRASRRRSALAPTPAT